MDNPLGSQIRCLPTHGVPGHPCAICTVAQRFNL